MRLRYEQLFNIGVTAAYYADGLQHDDFTITPTKFCKEQMSRYKVLSRKTFDGLSLFYECSPATNDVTPFRPINKEEKFTFLVSVTNADFWYFADVNNWETDSVYFLKNPGYNTTGDISILSGALNAPVLFRPMGFMFSVPLEAVARALEIRDAAGSVLKTLTIRARTAAEPVGKKEPYFVDLNRYQDGLYTLRHKSDGGDVDTSVYCCADYTPGTLAVIEITYKGGVAWTGVTPFQKYLINVTSRITDWFFDVNVRKQASGLVVPSQLSIIHVPVGAEPVQTFSVVGAADDPHGFVQFKSDAKLTYSQRPMHLRLVRPNAMDLPHPLDVINPVPLPSAITLQKDTLNNLITKIIVNV